VEVPTEALEPLITDELLNSFAPLADRLDRLVQRMDDWLAGQIQFLIHQPAFQTLESACRSLQFLVSHLRTDDLLYIRVLSVSKTELLNDTGGHGWVLRKKYLDEEYSVLGGSPYAMLVADFPFDSSPHDVRLLTMLAELADSGHSTLVTSVTPALFNCDSFNELTGKKRLAHLFQTPLYAEWRLFTESHAAQAVVAALPRLLSREIYLDAGTAPNHFRFDESIASASDLLWVGSAFALAERIARIYRRDEWWWHGVLEDWVVAQVPTWDCAVRNGQIAFCCPTEAPLDDQTAAALASLGFTCLHHEPGTDFAVFRQCSPLHAPASATERVGLRTLMNAWQLARYIRCAVRDDSTPLLHSDEKLVSFINKWLEDYVVADGSAADAGRPLAFVQVSLFVEEDYSRCVSVTLQEVGEGQPAATLKLQFPGEGRDC
jgi:type VI secretion system protein ImpC